MERKRLTYIDLLEAIAIFLVILYHSTLYTYDFMSESTLLHYLYFYFRTILATCVPLFFFANGYLLFSKEFVLRKHILKMTKLIILTIVWAIISLLILQVINHESLSFHELLKAVWEWKQGWINHLWYMGALICIYIFFPLLKNAYDANYQVFIYFTIVVAILTIGNTAINQFGTIIANSLLKKGVIYDGTNFFNIFNPLRGIHGYSFVYFCVGGIMYRFKSTIERIDVKKRNLFSALGLLLSCCGLFIIGLSYSRKYGWVWDVVWNGYDSGFTFVNVILIYILCLNWTRDSDCVRLISNNTLGIYFIHALLISYFKPLALCYDFTMNLPFNFLFAAFILALSLAVCLIIKKIPIVSNLVK